MLYKLIDTSKGTICIIDAVGNLLVADLGKYQRTFKIVIDNNTTIQTINHTGMVCFFQGTKLLYTLCVIDNDQFIALLRHAVRIKRLYDGALNIYFVK